MSNVFTGGTATASTYSGGYTPAKAFDNDLGTIWYTGEVAPQWLQYDLGLGNAKQVGQYSLYWDSGNGNARWIAWTLKASNTGAFAGEEVTVDSQTGQSLGYDTWYPYASSATIAYRYYRWNITSVTGVGSAPAITEITGVVGGLTFKVMIW